MEQYNVKMSANLEKDGTVVIIVSTTNASMVMRYKDKEEIAVLASNLEKILDYMWTDYLVRKEFSEQIENELEDWLNDGS